jgi:predicted CXXCH cytochrome family protein
MNASKKIMYAVIFILSFILFSQTVCSAKMRQSLIDIKFDHEKHKQLNDNRCENCHGETPGVIEGYNREWVHRVCTGCHEIFEAGPIGCKSCHNK